MPLLSNIKSMQIGIKPVIRLLNGDKMVWEPKKTKVTLTIKNRAGIALGKTVLEGNVGKDIDFSSLVADYPLYSSFENPSITKFPPDDLAATITLVSTIKIDVSTIKTSIGGCYDWGGAVLIDFGTPTKAFGSPVILGNAYVATAPKIDKYNLYGSKTTTICSWQVNDATKMLVDGKSNALVNFLYYAQT